MLRRRSFLASAAAAYAQAPPPAAKIISSVVLSMLPGSLEEKLWAVARAGIQSVELLGEFESERIRPLLRSYTLTVDTITALPDWSSTLAAASKLDAARVLLPANTDVERLRRLGDQAAKADLTLLVEKVELVKSAGHPQVRLLFDMPRTPDPVKQFEAASPHVKVIRAADPAPADFYRAVAKAGFEGHIALAYRPTGDTAASLIRAVDAMRRSLSAPPPPPTA
jgi:sugar phosphate isomerase/epimerase